LKNSAVYIIAGAKDADIPPAIVEKQLSFYNKYGAKTYYDLAKEAGHDSWYDEANRITKYFTENLPGYLPAG
jgi:predicted esterase